MTDSIDSDSSKLELQNVQSLRYEERSHLEAIAQEAAKNPLIKGEEFFPNHSLGNPSRRMQFIKHYLNFSEHANNFYDYVIRVGQKIIGYAAIDKGYNALKEYFPISVHFAFVSPSSTQYSEMLESAFLEECKRIELSNKKSKL